jgi:hypothetical protein
MVVRGRAISLRQKYIEGKKLGSSILFQLEDERQEEPARIPGTTAGNISVDKSCGVM